MHGASTLGANNTIFTTCTDPVGNVYAAGDFTNSAGKRYVARYGSGPAGIPETSRKAGLNLYPNPSTGNVIISSDKDFQSIRICSQTGEVVRYMDNLSTDRLGLSVADLAKGMYYVQVIQADDVLVRKLLVE